jgi:hypothetical protein
MGLSIASIQKIMREIFTGATPWRISPDERESAKQQIKERLSRLKNLKVDENPYYNRSSSKDKKEVLCTFFIDDPGNGWHGYHNFGLILNERRELMLGHIYAEEAAVSSIAEIEAFIAACQARLDRQVALANKRQKVREFKVQAIIAQVKQIAAEDQFEFFTESDSIKLKLSVRINETQAIQINIPFNRFQDVLSKLRSIIASVREVYQQGVYFKTKQIGAWELNRFIKPDK